MAKFSVIGFPFGGLMLAAAWWFVLFSPWTAPQYGFWRGMAIAQATLLGYSMWFLRGQWRPLFRSNLRVIALGIVSAVLLYGLFWVGHAILVAWIPGIGQSVEAVYVRRGQVPLWALVPLLGLWIGPIEELFWRGVLQNYLQQKLSPVGALLGASLLYSLVHIWSGNLPLLLAALVAGLAWGALFLWTKSLLPGILSHALWDVLMFVLFPLQ